MKDRVNKMDLPKVKKDEVRNVKNLKIFFVQRKNAPYLMIRVPATSGNRK